MHAWPVSIDRDATRRHWGAGEWIPCMPGPSRSIETQRDGTGALENRFHACLARLDRSRRNETALGRWRMDSMHAWPVSIDRDATRRRWGAGERIPCMPGPSRSIETQRDGTGALENGFHACLARLDR